MARLGWSVGFGAGAASLPLPTKMKKIKEKLLLLDASINTIEKFKSLVLEVSLFSLSVMGILGYVTTQYNYVYNRTDFRGVDPSVNLIFVFIFLCFYQLCRWGYYKAPAIFLVLSLLLAGVCITLRWGSLLPLGILILLMTITLTGVLLSVTYSFTLAVLTSFYLAAISYLQFNRMIEYDNSWLQDRFDLGDAFVIAVVLIFISSVAWYSNRKLQLLYLKSIEYEAYLKKQNDMLKDLVIRKTEEVALLKNEHLHRINNLVDIGKNTSGFFHDISNMITAVSLSLENLSYDARSKDTDVLVHEDISNTLNYMGKVRVFLESIRKQISTVENVCTFDPNVEINQILELFKNQLVSKKILINLSLDSKGTLNGNPVKFFQLVKNLLGNSIDSFYNSVNKFKQIRISTSNFNDSFIFEIYDNGCGIPQDVQDKIFDLFYSTKLENGGTGIGLNVCRDIVENTFGGTISYSSGNEGTLFTIKIPSNEIIKANSQKINTEFTPRSI